MVATATDLRGHFGGPFPVGRFSAAFGAVAVGRGEPVSVPIHLNEDGSFPETVILVVALPEVVEAGEKECDCSARGEVPRDPDAADLGRADGTYSSDPGAGRRVDFTRADHRLEEFTFSYIVRTTEPVIKSLTLDEPARIDIGQFG